MFSRGGFIEKDVKGYHSYYPNDDDMTGAWDFPHKLETNDKQGFRYARITATRAYIAVDEDAYGNPVIETWTIYSHRGE